MHRPACRPASRLPAVVLTLAFVLLAARAAPASATDAAFAARAKIAPWVVEHTTTGGPAEFIVVLGDQADLSPAARLRALTSPPRPSRQPRICCSILSSGTPLAAGARSRQSEPMRRMVRSNRPLDGAMSFMNSLLRPPLLA